MFYLALSWRLHEDFAAHEAHFRVWDCVGELTQNNISMCECDWNFRLVFFNFDRILIGIVS